MKLERGVFTRGRSPYRYLDALKANLFLSANEQDVMGALDARSRRRAWFRNRRRPRAGMPRKSASRSTAMPVLFSDEAERVFQRDGLDAFTRHETAHALKPCRRARSSRCWRRCTACRPPPAPTFRCACGPRSSPRAARRRTNARCAR